MFHYVPRYFCVLEQGLIYPDPLAVIKLEE